MDTAPLLPVLFNTIWSNIFLLGEFLLSKHYASVRLVCRLWERIVADGARQLLVPKIPTVDLSRCFPKLTTLSIAGEYEHLGAPVTKPSTISKLTSLTSLELRWVNGVRAEDVTLLTNLRKLIIHEGVTFKHPTPCIIKVERLDLVNNSTICDHVLRFLTSVRTLRVVNCPRVCGGYYSITSSGIMSMPNLQRVITDREDIINTLKDKKIAMSLES